MATVVFPVDPKGLVMAITTGAEIDLGQRRELTDFAIRSRI
jgi:hypothetical protein